MLPGWLLIDYYKLSSDIAMKRSRFCPSSRPTRDKPNPVDPSILEKATDDFRKDNIGLIRRHYAYVIFFQLLGHLYYIISNVFRKHVTFIWVDVLVFACTLAAAFLLKYIEKQYCNLLVFMLMLSSPISSYAYEFDSLLTPGSQTKKFNILERCLNIFVLEVQTYIITMNQPPAFYIASSAALYLLALPLLWPKENVLLPLPAYCYLIFIVAVHTFLRFKSEKDMLGIYAKKAETKSKLNQKSSLLQLISSSPVFIVKTPDLDKLYREERLFDSDMASSLSVHDALEAKTKLLNRLREYELKVFATETSCDSSPLTTHSLFSFLEKLKVSNGSKLECPKDPAPAKAGAKELQEKENELIDSILRSSFSQDDVCDVIFKIYRQIVDSNLRTLDCLFRLQAVELRESRSGHAQKPRHTCIFDVEFKYTYYDNSISIVIIVTDFSEKQILSRLEMINKEKETSLVAVVNDMRVPMNAIKEYTKTIRESTHQSAPELKNELDVIEANCEHLSLLIHDIIDNGFMVNSRLC